VKRVLAGPRFVLEAIDRDDPEPLEVLYVLGGDAERRHARIIALARALAIRVEIVGRRRLDELAEGLRHQGVLAIAPEFPYLSLDELRERASERPLFAALDEITDPHNFGAIVRSAVAFGVDGIIIPERRSAQVTGVVSRTSAGAIEHAAIARVVNLARALETLAEDGRQIVGLAGEAAATLDELEPAPHGRVLVVGSEGRGLRELTRKRCDVLVRIPMGGPISSLNASVAAGVAFYALTR
jgi:23S rRNA (guanosine2251-2'-O)-methyltransferase